MFFISHSSSDFLASHGQTYTKLKFIKRLSNYVCYGFSFRHPGRQKKIIQKRKSISRKMNARSIKCLHVWIKIRQREKDTNTKAYHFIHFFKKKSPVYFSSSFLLLFTKSWFQMNGCMCTQIWFFAVFFEIRRFYAKTFIMEQHSSISSFALPQFFLIRFVFFSSSFSFCFFFRLALFLNDFCCTLKTYALNACSWQQRAFSCTQFSIACTFS